MSFLYLAGAILSEVVGTLSLRLAGERHRGYYLVIVVTYPLALLFLVETLAAGMGIGVAYGIWAAVGVALTALASRFLFGERITRRMSVGLALICAGVVLIEMGAR